MLCADALSRLGQGTGPVWNRYYQFDAESLRLLTTARSFSALRIDLQQHRRADGSGCVADFHEEFRVLQDEGLLRIEEQCLTLTSRGMSYADSVAGLLGRRQRSRGKGASGKAGVDAPHGGNQRGYM